MRFQFVRQSDVFTYLCVVYTTFGLATTGCLDDASSYRIDDDEGIFYVAATYLHQETAWCK